MCAALCGPAQAWKEPAWTQTDAGRAAHSDAVLVATVESATDTPLRAAADHPLREAILHIERMQKRHALLQARPLAVYFEAPRNPGPDRGWVESAPGQRAVFCARARRLATGKTVLFLDFQSDVQPPRAGPATHRASGARN